MVSISFFESWGFSSRVEVETISVCLAKSEQATLSTFASLFQVSLDEFLPPLFESSSKCLTGRPTDFCGRGEEECDNVDFRGRFLLLELES